LDIKHNNIYENKIFPHEKKQIKIGNNSPIITNIKTENNVTYVFGDNFTPNSKVVVNKKVINSEYISKTCLKVKDYIPKPKDIFISVTFSNKNSPLNSSNLFEFLN
ncbi:MAG TPA: LTA synthase family protein, partial [Candidatus Dwaynia gallinarum]|nr:LTA synthase family protein [Candidatus Dwaynia gallinarum]